LKACSVKASIARSSVAAAGIFDLPTVVQPLVTRGERRERRVRVRITECERGERAVSGFMARFLGMSRCLPLFATRACFFLTLCLLAPRRRGTVK
jgi:hypothetical protein